MFVRIITFFTLTLFAVSASAEQSKSSYNQEVKKKIQWEIKGMQNDMLQLDITMRNLKQDKLEVQKELDSMRAWGIAQQKEKLEYYDNATKLSDQLDAANTKLLASEETQKALDRKYHRIRSILCYAVGCLLFVLFLRFGNIIVPLLGAYGPILAIGGPFASFGVGYFLIKLIF